MKLIYLVGPFRGPDSWAIACNVHKAAALALEVWKLGAACICPHLNTAQFQNAAPDKVWLDGGIEILKRCDAVILTADWQSSCGARAERIFAIGQGIPVFESIIDLRFWLQAQVKVDESRKQQAEREQYSNPRLGPMLEESERGRLVGLWQKAESERERSHDFMTQL